LGCSLSFHVSTHITLLKFHCVFYLISNNIYYSSLSENVWSVSQFRWQSWGLLFLYYEQDSCLQSLASCSISRLSCQNQSLFSSEVSSTGVKNPGKFIPQLLRSHWSLTSKYEKHFNYFLQSANHAVLLLRSEKIWIYPEWSQHHLTRNEKGLVLLFSWAVQAI